MKNAAKPTSHTHQRKIKYIDHVLQKWLLIALVVLEVLVLSIAGAILYVRLNAIVDASVYRIHFADQHSMFAVLLNESLRIIGGLIAVNLLALFVADRIWTYYVRSIISPLRVLLTRTCALDFRVDSEISERHEVLTRTLGWRRIERARIEALHHALDQMEAKSASSDTDFRQCLLALQAHLPLPSRAVPLPQLAK